MKANELGIPCFDVSVSCGSFCYGGSAKFEPTTYLEHTDADEVWCKGSDVAALAARLAEEQDEVELKSACIKGMEAQAELMRSRLAEAERLLTREEFQSELEALAINKPSAALRALMTIPFETWAKHLQADACKRIGVTPVQMFRRTTATAAASPQAAGESRDA